MLTAEGARFILHEHKDHNTPLENLVLRWGKTYPDAAFTLDEASRLVQQVQLNPELSDDGALEAVQTASVPTPKKAAPKKKAPKKKVPKKKAGV